MTDNEIMKAFAEGCRLISDNDTDRKDVTDLIGCLEKCAKEMIPYITKYNGKGCKNCMHYNKNYGCNLSSESKSCCKYSVTRSFFKTKKESEILQKIVNEFDLITIDKF